ALNFSSRGLDPRPILESDSTMHLVQAVSTGMCCAMMPLHSGVESLSEELRILPVIGATTMAPMGLLMRRTEPRSALAERCFEAAREIFMAEAD
ncbi:MAG: LysR substrate-binding domain-containing protein, partial [Oleiphilaceae bacterium]|nr:LysR substrate-binding domain-containing protein [Oleiphilaceae bacterium]